MAGGPCRSKWLDPSAGAAPIVIGYTFSRIGFGGVFLITTVVLVAGALAVALLGIGTAGKSLEQITRELEDTARRPRREPLLQHPSRASPRPLSYGLEEFKV